jgi:hypothetical protein
MVPVRSSLAGRFSRAAVFAGLASCTSNPPQRAESPPPPDEVALKQPPPAPPVDAKVSPGSIRGTVRDHAGNPVGYFALQLDRTRSVATDAQGNFAFDDVPPGRYQITMRPSDRPADNAEHHDVEVKAGAITRTEIRLPAPVVDPGPCCKPYGAPPARRRIV